MRLNIDVAGQLGTGPFTFATRLANELHKQGVELVDNNPDVKLVFIEEHTTLKAKKMILRLDGIWSKPEQIISGANASIQKTYSKSDCVIWQSDFDRKFSTRLFGDHVGTVIRNGIDVRHNFNNDPYITSTIEQIKSKHSHIFVCSANWHAQKRLPENIQLFQHLREKFFPLACLIIFGNNITVPNGTKNVYPFGHHKQDVYMQFFRNSTAMIHLAYADHCPNVVVEALSVGLPVICSETGGTKELVENCGFVMKENIGFSFEAFDYDSPPDLDLTQIKEWSNVDDNARLEAKKRVNITNVARNYIETFQRVLNDG